MIDLHIHTTYSAGTDTPKELLQIANRLNLSHISVTDHNSMIAYDELIKYRKYYDGVIIPGVEITTYYKHECIDILAYGVDKDIMQKLIKKNLKTLEKRRTYEVKVMTKKYRGLGFKIDEVHFNTPTELSFRAFYRELSKYPENFEYWGEEIDYKTWIRQYQNNPKSELFCDFSKAFPKPDKAIKLIKKAGGLAFLAHPFNYAFDVEKELPLLIKKYDFDGIECMHSTFSTEEILYLMKFCKENKLYRSGGSDYSGINKLNHQIKTGDGSLYISSALINNWVSKIKTI